MYEDLISQIGNYVKANANNEITGAGLNVILNSMLNALGNGMRFYGLATTFTQPVVNQIPKFYIAFKPGIYSRFVEAQPAFTSGFAILYDITGSNNWAIAVKSFDIGNTGFLVNALVRNNQYSDNIRFYIGRAKVSDSISTFTVYSTDSSGSPRDTIAAVFTANEQLSGLQTHRLVAGNGTVFYVSVDWDKLVLNEDTVYSYNDTRFPSEAYVDTASDVVFNNLLLQYMNQHSNTVAYWEEHATIIPKKGEIFIYEDVAITDADNNQTLVQRIKIGTGNEYLGQLPFIEQNTYENLESHIADNARHINEGEREKWNSKLNIDPNPSVHYNNETLFFNRN